MTAMGIDPAWTATVEGERLTWQSGDRTPTDAPVPVQRFDGLGGLGFSATLDDRPLDLTITEGACALERDRRSFPFTATAKLGETVLLGCAYAGTRPPPDRS